MALKGNGSRHLAAGVSCDNLVLKSHEAYALLTLTVVKGANPIEKS